MMKSSKHFLTNKKTEDWDSEEQIIFGEEGEGTVPVLVLVQGKKLLTRAGYGAHLNPSLVRAIASTSIQSWRLD